MPGTYHRFGGLVTVISGAPGPSDPAGTGLGLRYAERMARLRDDVARVRCPYCLERVELFVDPDTSGTFVEDCAVCCRPWTVLVERDGRGGGTVVVLRAQ